MGGGKDLRLIQIRLATPSFEKIAPTCQINSTASAESANQVPKRSQEDRENDAVIRVYDEAGNVIQTDEHSGDFREAS